MTTLTAILTAAMLAAPAHAEEGAEENTAPEFLLADLGVRVDLPKDWKMTRWSDWDFKAESSDGYVSLFAWGTDIQSPIGDSAEAWTPIHLAKMEELQGTDPKVLGTRIEKAAGVDVALVDLSFKGGQGVMYGATLPIFGQMFHVATVGSSQMKSKIDGARMMLVKRLEIQRAAAEVTPNAEVEASGITTALPDGWREPVKSELATVMPRISALGIEDLRDCWVAIHPKPAVEPDVMVTCQGGLYLGVVDQHSFAASDELVRAKMFGSVNVPPGEMVELSDRVGFQYHPQLSSSGLYVGVVPYDKGVARTWVVGAPDDATLATALRSALTSSKYTGAHPASMGDRVRYYLMHRTFSPIVLGPAALALLFLGLVGFLGIRVLGGGRRKSYAEIADAEDTHA